MSVECADQQALHMCSTGAAAAVPSNQYYKRRATVAEPGAFMALIMHVQRIASGSKSLSQLPHDLGPSGYSPRSPDRPDHTLLPKTDVA